MLSRSELLARTSPFTVRHVGDFLGPFVDEQHEDVHLGMVRRHRLGQMLEEDRLAGARRGHDQPALASADRGEQVHDAHRERLLAGLEANLLARIDRGQFVEAAFRQRIGSGPFDRGDAREPHGAGGTLAVRLDRPGDELTLPEMVVLDERSGHEGIGGLSDVVLLRRSEVAVTFRVQFENAFAERSSH